MFDFWKKRRREALRAAPFPEPHRVIMHRNVPYVQSLGQDDRTELEALVQVFLAEKSFEGAGGLEMTDEIRVTIAAQACLLLLHRDTNMYPELDSIVVYPHAYRAAGQRLEGVVVIDEDQVRLGESWSRGTVVLAWDHVQRGASLASDGHNVVLHEFAHQLDAEDGNVDGAPALGRRARYAAWAKVLGAEFEELSSRIHTGRPSDIDPYGATSPPEFFAVVTEMFFERPIALRARHPELYEELRGFYLQDPAAAAERLAEA
jgi:Mlc titration factor MtfA (ptsG expression regulator)